jgi:hypothetical protein
VLKFQNIFLTCFPCHALALVVNSNHEYYNLNIRKKDGVNTNGLPKELVNRKLLIFKMVSNGCERNVFLFSNVGLRIFICSYFLVSCA